MLEETIGLRYEQFDHILYVCVRETECVRVSTYARERESTGLVLVGNLECYLNSLMFEVLVGLDLWIIC